MPIKLLENIHSFVEFREHFTLTDRICKYSLTFWIFPENSEDDNVEPILFIVIKPM
jgi:hypothetical protein